MTTIPPPIEVCETDILPIRGMTVRPDDCHGFESALGWPGFLGCVHWALTTEAIRDQFKGETGIDLIQFVRPQSAINAMIDEATGFKAQSFAEFADWVATNYWGAEAVP